MADTAATAVHRYRRQVRLSIALAGAATFIALLLPLLLGRFYYGIDLNRSDLGYLCAIRNQLERHQGLLLSATIGDGYFLWGHPIAQLAYPIRWLELLVPPDFGASLGVVLHLSLAAAATAWLASTFRIRPWLSSAAGIAFAFSGTSLDLINRTFCIVAAAWLPLAWAAARVASRRKRLPLALLGVALGMLLLGGEVQEYGVAVALVGLEGAVLLLRRRAAALERVARMALVSLTAVGVGLIVWWPAHAETSLTRRAGILSEAEALKGSLPAVSALGLLWPNVVNEPVQPNSNLWSVTEGPGGGVRWNPNPFVGVLLLGAALLGLRLRRTRTAAIAFVVGLAFAMGGTLPILPAAMKLLPPLRLFRYPAKYAVVATLGLVICGFAALQRSLRSASARRLIQVAYGILLVANLAVAAWLFSRSAWLNGLAAGSSEGLPDTALPELSGLLLRAALVAALFLFVAIVVLTQPRRARWVPALVVLQLCGAALATLVTGPPIAQAHSSAVGQASRLCVATQLQNMTLAHPGDPDAELATQQFHRLLGLPDLQACDGITSPLPYAPFRMRTTEELAIALDQGSVEAARALGCTEAILASPPSAGATSLRWNVAPELQGAFAALPLISVQDPIAEVFASPSPRLVSEPVVIPAVLSSTSAADAVAVVDDPLRRLHGAALPTGGVVRSASVERQGLDGITVHVEGTGGAVVGVRTSFLAGWSASQNGRRVPVVRVAGQHLGAVVSNVGDGPIVFQYRVPHLPEAIVAAVLSLALMIVVIATAGRRARTGHAG